MITNILVPVDFSDVANNALSFALQLAKKCNAEVHVLHVNYIPVTDIYFPATVYPEIVAEMQGLAEENFDKLRKTFKDKGGFVFKDTIVSGSVVDEINKYAREQQTDLVIMGTTGAGDLAGLLIGSNAATVVSRSEIPVMVIPPAAKYEDLEKIVYATDYSEPEFPSVSRLIYLAELFDSEVLIFHVKSEYDRYFRAESNFFSRNKGNISYHKWKMVQSDEPDIMDGINHFLEKEHANLLVVAKHKRSFFDRIFHRSLSKRMSFHTNIPLLVLNK